MHRSVTEAGPYTPAENFGQGVESLVAVRSRRQGSLHGLPNPENNCHSTPFGLRTILMRLGYLHSYCSKIYPPCLPSTRAATLILCRFMNRSYL